MDVSCPACAARYTADEQKLRGKTARMRCKACNGVWLVSGPDAKPTTAKAAAVPAPASTIPRPADAQASAKRAAVVKRGSEREKRDLFAEPSVDIEIDAGAGKQTLLPPPSFSVGTRNEDSVLFSIEQLAAGSRLKTPEPMRAETAPRGSDDEGVIDLKALSSSPPPALRPVGLPVAPLFSEPPPVTLEVDRLDDRLDERAGLPTPRPRKSKLRLVAGMMAMTAMLAAAGYGISIAFKGEEPIRHDPIVAATPPPPTPETASPPPPQPVAAADTTDATDKDATEKETTPKGKGKKGKKGKRKGAASAASAKGAAPAAAKAPKPADPCGCHGDFNCILACTARGGK